jgi:hypothetical protein
MKQFSELASCPAERYYRAPMEVLFLTIFLSLILSALFFAGFIRSHLQQRGKSMEQQSLMPLEQDRFTYKP